MFLGAFDDPNVLRHFVKHGGRETIMSYGLDKARYNALTLEELQAELPQIVPAEHVAFLKGLDEMVIAGDYAFVHAGVDWTRPLEEQSRHDLLWIREKFLAQESDYSHVIVHGHTIFDDVIDNGTRIGIDTGAYRSGRLTALILEGAKRRYLNTVDHDDGKIAIEHTDG